MHIILYRNIFKQWCSYSYQFSRSNRFFIDKNYQIIERNLHDKTLKNIYDLFYFGGERSELEVNFCRFVLLHLYLYAYSVPAADFVFDLNLAAAQKSHQQAFEDLIGQHGLSIDLSGTTDSILYSSLEAGRSAELVEEIALIAGGIIDAAPSPEGRRFGNKALAEFLEEHDRYNHYTKFIRSVLIKTNERSDASKAELMEAERARDAFRAAHDTAVIQRDAAEQANQAAQAERAEAERAREELRQAHENAVLQRDAAEQARAAVQNAYVEGERTRDELRRSLEAALIQRDAAEKGQEAERVEAERTQTALRQAHEAALAQRDAAVQAAQAETEEAREALRRVQDVARAQREATDRARASAETARADAEEAHEELRRARQSAAPQPASPADPEAPGGTESEQDPPRAVESTARGG